MSGHSKWATIKRRKGAQDAKRGQLFTKLIKEITVAARQGGGEEDTNPRLRSAVLNARAANMPKDNIQRAIQKGAGGSEGANYLEISYEGYGPSGVAIFIDALTDNKNRTAADIRNIFAKHGGNLGENGCVAYLFELWGLIHYDAAQYAEDAIIEAALEAGASDVLNQGESIEVQCEPKLLHEIVQKMVKQGLTHQNAQVARLPSSTIALEALKTEKALKLIELLDDHDDIREVATNLEIPDEYDI